MFEGLPHLPDLAHPLSGKELKITVEQSDFWRASGDGD